MSYLSKYSILRETLKLEQTSLRLVSSILATQTGIFCLFSTVNARIQDVQMKLEQGKERLATKQGELVVKNSKLADVEMEVKLLQLRKDILQNQRKDVTEEKHLLCNKHVRSNNILLLREVTALALYSKALLKL